MAEAGDTRAGIGTRLRTAREKKGLTLLQAAERMHVDPRILEWLEAEDFAALGAPVYARGHLRHYAELVDESPTQLQELYAEATRSTPAQPDLTKIARAEPEPDTGRFAVPGMVGLVALAIIGTVWWFIQTGENGHPVAQNQVVSQSPAPESKTLDNSGGAPGPPPAPNPTPPAPAMASTKPTTPGARSVVTNALIASAATSSSHVAHADAGAPADATAPPPSPRGKEGELTLKFNADSWAEVYDATGERLFYDVGAASSTHTVRGPAPLRVVLGNAAGVTLEFNGRPAAVPASTRPDGSAKFVINAHGRTVAASPASSGD
jgi:cytoskeleton protein RodZ